MEIIIPKKLLREVALHLNHDAEVNGSRQFGFPYGRLTLSTEPNALWARILEMIEDDHGADSSLLLELSSQLSAGTGGGKGEPVSCVPLYLTPGSLWSRIIDAIGGEPDIIADVLRPAIYEHLASQ